MKLPVRTLLFASSLFLALATTAVTATAQSTSCSTLSMKGGGSANTTITLSLRRSASSSFAILVVGRKAGMTVLPLGQLGKLTLGIKMPFIPVPMSKTDIFGNASVELKIGPATPKFAVKVQDVSYGFSLLPRPSLGWCTSTVVDVKGGTKRRS